MSESRITTQSVFKTFFAAILLVTVLFAAPARSYGQETEEPKKEFRFADQDLLNFYDVNQELSVLQKETNEKIVAAVEAKGLSMDRFNQIARAAEIGALQGGMYLDEEVESFNQVAPEITAIQRDMQGILQATLMEKGLTTDYYQEIMSEFRSDADLQNHVRELLRERARQAAREARQRERELEEQNKQ
ncbi:MAG: DUF4168 domain-containing protein [Bacteroidales bacterium]|jgi:hypothetical protein|nr:DUF4168 domain-containing protein [Bacteroidales bacterium]NLM93550.1 DUF4168 domain-containing protein [Bacteroidales bacterium]